MEKSGIEDRDILLIEDNIDDISIIKEALVSAGIKNQVNVCNDGDSALEYLHQSNENNTGSGLKSPVLILLDLNLPGTDGKETLEQIKGTPYKNIPVIVLTTSSDARDVKDSYALGADSYLIKPKSIPEYVDLFKALKSWWFEVNTIPD